MEYGLDGMPKRVLELEDSSPDERHQHADETTAQTCEEIKQRIRNALETHADETTSKTCKSSSQTTTTVKNGSVLISLDVGLWVFISMNVGAWAYGWYSMGAFTLASASSFLS